MSSFPIQGETSSQSRERRRSPRVPAVRPVKVRCGITGRYLSARSVNVSASGALLEISHPSLLVPGQPVQVGIAWREQQTVLTRDELAAGTVVRSLGLGATQTVAVHFDHHQPLHLQATA